MLFQGGEEWGATTPFQPAFTNHQDAKLGDAVRQGAPAGNLQLLDGIPMRYPIRRRAKRLNDPS